MDNNMDVLFVSHRICKEFVWVCECVCVWVYVNELVFMSSIQDIVWMNRMNVCISFLGNLIRTICAVVSMARWKQGQTDGQTDRQVFLFLAYHFTIHKFHFVRSRHLVDCIRYSMWVGRQHVSPILYHNCNCEGPKEYRPYSKYQNGCYQRKLLQLSRVIWSDWISTEIHRESFKIEYKIWTGISYYNNTEII